MRYDGAVAIRGSQFDRCQGFGERPDLVRFDQDRVGDTLVNALREEVGVGHKQIIAYELHLVPKSVGQQFPAVPVALVHAVFDRQDRILARQCRKPVDKLR